MDSEELNVVAALIAGLQLAIVHLAKNLEPAGETPCGSLAESFRETAENIPAETRNRELIAQVLAQVATGIEGSNTPDEPGRTYLRLIKGGKQSRPATD